MTTTVLQIITDFTERMGLPTPAGVVGSGDKGVRQIRALLTRAVEELKEYRWQQQTLRKTFTSLAGNDQGSLESLFGADYFGLVTNSMWNNTRRMRVYGPLAGQIWQALQVLPNAGPEFQSWISGNHLYVSPAFVIGETISALYETKYCVLAVDGITTKDRFTADDDSFLFPDNVIQASLEYRWRKQKGEAGWEDDYNAYIGLLAKNLTRDGMPTLALSSNRRGPQPGIVIPAGSWNV